MKTSKVTLLVAGLGLCSLFFSAVAFSDTNSATDMKKKKMESAMVIEASSMDKPVSEEMKNSMETGMEKPMAAEMEKPMAAEMEKPIKADLKKPMTAGMEDTMKTGMKKPMQGETKMME